MDRRMGRSDAPAPASTGYSTPQSPKEKKESARPRCVSPPHSSKRPKGHLLPASDQSHSASGTRHRIIPTLMASFTTRHETIA